MLFHFWYIIIYFKIKNSKYLSFMFSYLFFYLSLYLIFSYNLIFNLVLA